MDKNISRTIMDICKKEGINYQSPYQQEVLFKDASRLGEIITEINCLIDELDCICSRHKLNTYTKQQIQQDLALLHSIDHDLVNLAQKIKKDK
jgi:hypothetical protein